MFDTLKTALTRLARADAIGLASSVRELLHRGPAPLGQRTPDALLFDVVGVPTWVSRRPRD